MSYFNSIKSFVFQVPSGSYHFFKDLMHFLGHCISDTMAKVHKYREFILRFVFIGMITLLCFSNISVALLCGAIYALAELSQITVTEDKYQSTIRESLQELNLDKLEVLARYSYGLSFPDTTQHDIARSKVATASYHIGENASPFVKQPLADDLYALLASKESDSILNMAFRGTSLYKLDTSIEHDFDANGPGYGVFQKHKKTLLKALVEKVSDKETINLCGHSLGGAYAMMMAVELLDRINEGELTGIKTINVALYQSAGVNNRVAERAETLLKTLLDKQSPVHFNIISHDYDFDPVPASGQQILGDYHGENASVYLVRKRINWAAFAYQLATFNPFLGHSLWFYNSSREKSTDYISNADKAGVLQYFSSKQTEHQESISKSFNATYFKLISNSLLQQFIGFIGVDNIVIATNMTLFLLSTVSVGVNMLRFASLPRMYHLFPLFGSVASCLLASAKVSVPKPVVNATKAASGTLIRCIFGDALSSKA
ncbi:lipase family protein [Candidatus Synchoanobacter obligatus]|uniref:Fungal lipase-type domain-containing protein n=1 Tax=Candidatus Synchoanobacter obligatus TaxID=2919597 RepID=A0ABT1L5R2_9GAMM|nr:hypothetical protein [Candidatus Synchoanobacter obligatus]MCP8352512.1 hypothetical protein [Candidatus Synchoanobacter obligatus]